jgi:hypothetical protein
MIDRKPQIFAWIALIDNSGRVLSAVALILVLEAMPSPAGIDKAEPAVPEVTTQWEGYAGGTIIPDEVRVSAPGFEQATPILPPPEPDR